MQGHAAQAPLERFFLERKGEWGKSASAKVNGMEGKGMR